MGTELLQWMLAYPTGRYRGSAELLIETFGDSPNIEDVITQLVAAIETLDSDAQEDRVLRSLLGNARGQIAEAIREWFREVHLNAAPAYAEFADRVIEAGDVVITFNYDDSLERELKRAGKWDLSRGYGFALGAAEQPSPVLVLKLHGSINWLASLFSGATSGPFAVGSGGSIGQQPVVHKADAEFLGYVDFSGSTYPGGGAFPSLILPGRKKEFFYATTFGEEWIEFWDTLWTQASHALSRCRKIVLAGYSLLPVDERACDLILNVPSKTTGIIVVSGDQSKRIAGDFRRAGFCDVSFKGCYFEQWVKRTS
jgi:hypothetical protein